MLELGDFVHLPQARSLVDQVVALGPGLTVVAGLDRRPLERGFLPSGRAALTRVLMREILDAHPGLQAVLVTPDPDAARLPRTLRRRVDLVPVPAPDAYARTIARAAGRRPGLLVVDDLTSASAAAALEAASTGLAVLSQIDTLFWADRLARDLLDLGVPRDLLSGLAWVIGVQRLPTLCPRCKEPIRPAPQQVEDWCRRYPFLAPDLRRGTYFRAVGCSHCRHTGRDGEITALDLFRAPTAGRAPAGSPGHFPLEAYLLGLAGRGHLPPDDALHLESDRLRMTYRLLVSTERAMGQAQATLERRLAELEAANRVLQQRTEALVSLEGIGQALIDSTDLAGLAGRLCRSACHLCGADRAILYFLQSEGDVARVLAASGWDPAVVGRALPAGEVFAGDSHLEAAPFDVWPPGVPRQPTDRMSLALRAGLRVPLVAQERPVGLMIVHTSQKAAFAPSDVALLQAFANQAALAIQRADLIEALQAKILQLEAAQAELVKKERLERELELARQVQQSVLPRIFPLVPGYAFAAHNEAARWVGGDFYDVVLLDADRFALVIGDVSDKGMPAALYMAQTHSLLRAECRQSARSRVRPSPRAILENVHRLLQELGRAEMFVTVFCGIVDVQQRRMTYTRAGHDRPLLLRAGRARPLGGEGTVLGFPGLDDLHLSEEQVDLDAGDRLVLYTDGLIDVVAPGGQPFGLERLEALLVSHDRLPAAELCATVFDRLAAYQDTADRYDDMTLLVVEVR